MLYVVSLSAISEAVAQEDLFSYRMPNEWNFAFDFMYFVSATRRNRFTRDWAAVDIHRNAGLGPR
jgi:hypothetical protein